MVKIAEIVSLIILTGKGLLFGNEVNNPVVTPPPITETAVKEDETGFITLVDTANLFTITIPADWKTLYVPEEENIKSGIVSFSSDENFTMKNLVTRQEEITPNNCSLIYSGQITIDSKAVNYSECSANAYKLLTTTYNKDGLFYQFVFQYNPEQYPQGSELAKTILASTSFIK
jgi:hypothetical protein